MRRSVFAWGRHLAGSAPTRGWQDERSRPCPGTLRHSCSQVLTFSCCVGLRVPYCSTPCTMALWVFIVAIKDLTFGCPSAQDVFGYHDKLGRLGGACVQQGVSPNVPEETGLVLRAWIRAHKTVTGPLAAYNAVKWLRNVLQATVLLDDLQRPRKAAKSKENRGQAQAIVAEPGMISDLEQMAERLHAANDWRVAAVCCTHAVVAAVMRMGHLERSRFLRLTKTGHWLRAYRGKSRDSMGFRPAFDWFYPLHCVQCGSPSPASILHNVWDKWSRRNGAPLHYLTLDAETGLKMSGQQVGIPGTLPF